MSRVPKMPPVHPAADLFPMLDDVALKDLAADIKANGLQQPVVMLAGDQAACDELLALQPKAVTVAVKKLAGKASTLSLSQLKILQEVITLGVFVPFAVLYMRQPIKLDFLWAGLCLLGAVYFMFR